MLDIYCAQKVPQINTTRAGAVWKFYTEPEPVPEMSFGLICSGGKCIVWLICSGGNARGGYLRH